MNSRYWNNFICREREYAAFLSIFALTIIGFSPTFFNGFQMEWDDQWMVFNAQTAGHPSWYLLLSIFTLPSHGQLAPINQMMYIILISYGLYPLNL